MTACIIVLECKIKVLKHWKLYKDAYILQESFAMTDKSYPPPCHNYLYLSMTLYACAQRDICRCTVSYLRVPSVYMDNEGATCEDDTSVSDIDQTNMGQATHTFIYMLLSISGMQYSALVDTGSSINIKSRLVYDALPSSQKSIICYRVKLYITNFPFLSSNIPSSPAYGVFISQLIRYASACSSYECFILRAARLSSKLLVQVYVMERLKSSLRKFDGRRDLIKHYEVSLSQMLHDILGHYYVQ